MVVVYNILLFLYVLGLSCSFIRMEFTSSENPVSNSEFSEEVKTGVESDALNLDGYSPVQPTKFEPPPEICPKGIRCGFQIYDEKTRKPNQLFIKYCLCPEGYTCVKAGQSIRQCFFYYKCKVLEGTESEEDIADLSRTQEFGVSILRNLRTEEVQPAKIKVTKTVNPESASITKTVPDVHVPDSIPEITRSHDKRDVEQGAAIPEITGSHDERDVEQSAGNIAVEGNYEEIDRHTAMFLAKIRELVGSINDEVVYSIINGIKRGLDSASKPREHADPRDEL